MSNNHFLYSKPYTMLYEIWKNERTSDVIQPLEFNFFTQIWNELNNSTLTNYSETIIEELILNRVNFFLKSLKTIRWNKINSYIVRDLHLDTSLLASQEIEFFNYLKILYEQYKNIPNNSEKFFNNFSSFKETEGIETRNKEKLNSKKENLEKINKELKVKFLIEVNEFLGSNLQSYGPFKINEISILPERIVSTILLPRKIVELVND